MKIDFGAGCEHENTEVVGAYDATCTADGYTGDVVCSDCGEVVQQGEVISALGHDEEWVVVREATEDEDGLEQLICRRDGEVLDERVIPKIGGGTSDDSGSQPGEGDGEGKPTDNPGSGESEGSQGGAGESDDSHDQKTKPGVGQEGTPDTQDGAGPAGASAPTSEAPSSTTTQAAAQGGSTQPYAQTAPSSSPEEITADGKEISAMGTVYRVGVSGGGGDSDEEAAEASAATAIDFTVTGFPILWVLMWLSLPSAFAVGFGRRFACNVIGFRRSSRLAT